MAILSDRWIREQAQNHHMIEPFVEAQRRDGCISFGLSSFGYDARVADEFKIFTNVDNAIVDPKDFAATSFVDRKTDRSEERRVGKVCRSWWSAEWVKKISLWLMQCISIA